MLEDDMKKAATDELKYIIETRNEVFTRLARSSLFSKAEHQDENLYTICMSGVDLSFINAIWQKELSCPTDQMIKHIAQLFSKKRLSFLWWETARKDLISYATKLLEYGFSQEGFYRGYIRKVDVTNSMYSVREDIEIIQVSEKQQLDFLQVFRDVFGIVGKGARDFLALVFADNLSGQMLHYIAYRGPIPVSVITLVAGDIGASIWNLATVKEFRNEGIASLMIEHAVEEAKRRGYNKIAAVGSPEYTSIWKSLDFEEVCYFPVYSKNIELGCAM